MMTVAADADVAVALALVGVALLVVPNHPRLRIPITVGRRIRRAVGTGHASGTAVGQAPDDDSRSGSGATRAAAGRRSWLLAGALTAATALIAPDLWWLALGTSALVPVVLARRTSRRTPARRRIDRLRLAVHEDLLASCLDAGMAVAPALRAVAQALSRAGPAKGQSGDLADRANDGPIAALDAVAAMLALGADPESAWQHADVDPDLVQLAGAARRSASGGAGFADAVREHAAALRADAAAESVRAAGRAGVLMTAPLGLCFLPAFVCWGLAPVVVGLISQLDIF